VIAWLIWLWHRWARRGAAMIDDDAFDQQVAAAVDWIRRSAEHYPKLTTKKWRRVCLREINRAIAELEQLVAERCPDIVAEFIEVRDDLAKLVATVDAMPAADTDDSPAQPLKPVDQRKLIRASRGYIGQAGPPPRRPQKAFGPFVRGAETRLSAADYRKRVKPSENNPPRKNFQPGIFGNGFVCPRGRR
jgi:hypothetical protein